MANIISSKEFENEVYEELVVYSLVIKIYIDSLIELSEELSAMSKEFQYSFILSSLIPRSICLTLNLS